MVIFSDGFESGDFSVWTGTTVSAGSSATVGTTNVHHGNRAAQFFASAGYKNCRAYKTLGSSYSTIYMRIYGADQTLPNNGHQHEIMNIEDTASNRIIYVELRNDAGVYTWKVRNVVASATYTSAAVSITANQKFCLEVELIVADAPNGAVYLWYDGTSILSTLGVDTNGAGGNAKTVSVGTTSVRTSESCTTNVDCVVVADAYIGREATIKKGNSPMNTMTQMLNSKMFYSAVNRYPKLTPRQF